MVTIFSTHDFLYSSIQLLGLLCLLPFSVPRLDRVDQSDHSRTSEHLTTNRRSFGGILHNQSLRTLKEKKTICYPISFVVYNTKPVGHQVINDQRN